MQNYDSLTINGENVGNDLLGHFFLEKEIKKRLSKIPKMSNEKNRFSDITFQRKIRSPCQQKCHDQEAQPTHGCSLDCLAPYKKGATGGSMGQRYHFCLHSPHTFPHPIEVDASFDLKVVARGA
jgi:hypothetical protein